MPNCFFHWLVFYKTQSAIGNVCQYTNPQFDFTRLTNFLQFYYMRNGQIRTCLPGTQKYYRKLALLFSANFGGFSHWYLGTSSHRCFLYTMSLCCPFFAFSLYLDRCSEERQESRERERGVGFTDFRWRPQCTVRSFLCLGINATYHLLWPAYYSINTYALSAYDLIPAVQFAFQNLFYLLEVLGYGRPSLHLSSHWPVG